jgi:hypothetical protein
MVLAVLYLAAHLHDCLRAELLLAFVELGIRDRLEVSGYIGALSIEPSRKPLARAK